MEEKVDEELLTGGHVGFTLNPEPSTLNPRPLRVRVEVRRLTGV